MKKTFFVLLAIASFFSMNSCTGKVFTAKVAAVNQDLFGGTHASAVTENGQTVKLNVRTDGLVGEPGLDTQVRVGDCIEVTPVYTVYGTVNTAKSIVSHETLADIVCK